MLNINFSIGSENLFNRYIYCADIYGIAFYKLISNKAKIKNFIDDNKYLKPIVRLPILIKSFEKIKFSKNKSNIFFVCTKDDSKFKQIQKKIYSKKLNDPKILKINFN